VNTGGWIESGFADETQPAGGCWSEEGGVDGGSGERHGGELGDKLVKLGGGEVVRHGRSLPKFLQSGNVPEGCCQHGSGVEKDADADACDPCGDGVHDAGPSRTGGEGRGDEGDCDGKDDDVHGVAILAKFLINAKRVMGVEFVPCLLIGCRLGIGFLRPLRKQDAGFWGGFHAIPEQLEDISSEVSGPIEGEVPSERASGDVVDHGVAILAKFLSV